MRKKLGLSGKLMLMILFSALASAVFLVGMQVVLNKALWLYFDQPETQQRAVEKQVQELQSYIDRRGLSSRDIDKLDDWSVRNGSTVHHLRPLPDALFLLSAGRSGLRGAGKRDGSGSGRALAPDVFTHFF